MVRFIPVLNFHLYLAVQGARYRTWIEVGTLQAQAAQAAQASQACLCVRIAPEALRCVNSVAGAAPKNCNG